MDTGPLNKTQFQILGLAAKRLTSREIGWITHQSIDTIEHYLGTSDPSLGMYPLIDVTERPQAIRWYLEYEREKLAKEDAERAERRSELADITGEFQEEAQRDSFVNAAVLDLDNARNLISNGSTDLGVEQLRGIEEDLAYGIRRLKQGDIRSADLTPFWEQLAWTVYEQVMASARRMSLELATKEFEQTAQKLNRIYLLSNVDLALTLAYMLRARVQYTRDTLEGAVQLLKATKMVRSLNHRHLTALHWSDVLRWETISAGKIEDTKRTERKSQEIRTFLDAQPLSQYAQYMMIDTMALAHAELGSEKALSFLGEMAAINPGQVHFLRLMEIRTTLNVLFRLNKAELSYAEELQKEATSIADENSQHLQQINDLVAKIALPREARSPRLFPGFSPPDET